MLSCQVQGTDITNLDYSSRKMNYFLRENENQMFWLILPFQRWKIRSPPSVLSIASNLKKGNLNVISWASVSKTRQIEQKPFKLQVASKRFLSKVGLKQVLNRGDRELLDGFWYLSVPPGPLDSLS